MQNIIELHNPCKNIGLTFLDLECVVMEPQRGFIMFISERWNSRTYSKLNASKSVPCIIDPKFYVWEEINKEDLLEWANLKKEMKNN